MAKNIDIDKDAEREELKGHLTEYVSMITQADPKAGKRHYICPFCGSGAHGGRKSDGAFSIREDGKQWKCFSCNRGGDLFTLIGEQENLPEFKDQIQRARDLYGTRQSSRKDKGGEVECNDTIKVDERKQSAAGSPQRSETGSSDLPTEDANKTRKTANESVKKGNTPGLYKDKLKKATADVAGAADYLHGRGINDKTIEKYFLGYSLEYFPKAERELPAVTFPYNTEYSYYSARSLDGKFFKKPNTDEAGEEPLYNPEALYGIKPCFVCEGALDALSIIQSGGQSVALIGTAYQKLIDQIDRREPTQPLVLFLDHDEPDEQGKTPGQENQVKLAAELKKRGLVYVEAVFNYDLYQGKHKDANDLLQTNAEQLRADVERITAEAEAAAAAAKKPDNVRTYIDTLMSKEIEQFSHNIKSGYINLDEVSTGLYSGLYVIAAISSLGKTTFAHQMCDQIAAAGNDVLFFSLEMSRLEMVTKSIARITAQHDINTAVTSLNIRKGYLTQNVLDAVQEYKEKVGDRVSIIEGNFNSDIDYIQDQIKGYIDRNSVKPVVIIDYLQIVQPAADARQTTKETVDMTVTQLKRISREYGLTIIAICSVNRANYLTPISFESLKESGNIEFSADVIYGLQLHCLKDSDFEKETSIVEKREWLDEEKAAEPRQIDLVCLKNRFGIANFTCFYEYRAANDLFIAEGYKKSQKRKPKPKNIR